MDKIQATLEVMGELNTRLVTERDQAIARVRQLETKLDKAVERLRKVCDKHGIATPEEGDDNGTGAD